ncbi:MAG: extracellular solute-binding protein [Lachnospiraceae bacterium]|nr:extracellular solute-binding protein [Lachnospiraceae bacterium]
MKKKIFKRMITAAMAGVLAFSMAACGGNGGENPNSGTNGGGSNGGSGNQGGQDGGYVWVPKYYDLSKDAGEDVYYGNFSFIGSSLYYEATTYGEESHSGLMKLDLNNPQADAVEIVDLGQYEAMDEENGIETYVSNMAVGEDGSLFLLLRLVPILSGDATDADWQRRERETTYHVKKIAADGSEVFDADVTDALRMVENSWPQQMLADKEGNFYIHDGNNYAWIFDKDGNLTASVPLSQGGQWSYIQSMAILPDGRLAILQNGSGDMEIQVYNADTRQFSDTYDKLPPNCYNSDMSMGPNGGVLLKGDGMLWEYDLEKKEYTEILNWINCDINEDYVQASAALEDGRIAVYTRDWGTDEKGLTLLEWTPASEVVQKVTITLGCMSVSQSMQSAVVNFNKTNDKYRVEVKEYAASIDWSVENAYEDARTQFYNDILTGNAPDMFVANDIDLKMFAQKGLMEDLSSYLDGSTVLKRADLFESVLNAYTISGTLCAIPSSFTVRTLVGRTSELGEKPGWTMADMVAYAEQYPDADIFPHATKDRVLSTCIMFDFDAWVNWETGECFFDTPEFKAVLEFANKYPMETSYEGPSEPILLMNHSALLQDNSFSEPQDWQVSARMFDEPITAIGYPSSNSNGVLVTGQDGICLSSSSQNKEAAWAFIEFMLASSTEANGFFMWGYPISITAYNKEMEEAMEADYQLDEEGNPVLDENGEPIEVSHHSYGWGDDFEMYIYSVKQEEADSLLKLINSVDGIYQYNSSLMSIIEEETAPYFAGQKNVNEVADIIQSRVRIYINESR